MTTTNYTITTERQKVYVRGEFSETQKRLLQDLGFHYPDIGCWWVGAVKLNRLGGEQWLQQQLQEADERQQQLDEQRAAQRAEQAQVMAQLDDVDPHWPTYRLVMDLIRDCGEYFDAARHGDTGDMVAYQSAPEQLEHTAELAGLSDEFAAADILSKMLSSRRALTERQAKLVAITLAKLASRNGLSGNKPLSADTAHDQAVVTAELPEQVIDIQRDPAQLVTVTVTSSTKATKPYLAVLTGRRDRQFARGRKVTGTTRMFSVAVPVGTVLEWRSYTWTGDAYEGGVEHAIVMKDGLLLVSKETAIAVAEGANAIAIDSFTAVKRFRGSFMPEQPAYAGSHLAGWRNDQVKGVKKA